MIQANYTSGNIARALGLTGFANDEMLGPAQQALRVLLMPSFTPEICISFIHAGDSDAVRVHVVAARFHIWHQVGPAPAPVLTENAEGRCGIGAFESLVALLHTAAHPGDSPRHYVIADGMRVHSVLRGEGRGIIDLDMGFEGTSAHDAFAHAAITLAWQSIASPGVRNALRPDLAPQHPPPAKPRVQTLVIGGEEEKARLLAALKRHHGA